MLQQLTIPFEPIKEASLKYLTFKTVFLLTLDSGKHRSEIHAWQNKNIRHQSDWSKVSLYPSPSFLSKNQLAKDGQDSVALVDIPALAPILDKSLKSDRSLCLVRALCYYLDRTSDLRQNECTYTCMRLTTSDSRFAMGNFLPTFSIFCKHPSNSLVIRFFGPRGENCCHKLGIVCRKSESDTCKQPNINEKKGKNRCCKSTVGCHKPHTCVRTLRSLSLSPSRKFLTKISPLQPSPQQSSIL